MFSFKSHFRDLSFRFVFCFEIQEFVKGVQQLAGGPSACPVLFLLTLSAHFTRGNVHSTAPGSTEP